MTEATQAQATPPIVTPMFRLVNSEVKDLTRQFAEEFRTLTPSPTERMVSEGRVTHLANKAKAGLLVTFSWATAKLGDTTYRMNGQHSSAMLCSLDGAMPAGLRVHLDQYEVGSPEGLALLFRQFDDRRSARSVSDVSGAYQGLYEPIRAIPREVAQLGMEGTNWYHKMVEGLPVPSGDDQFSRFSDVNIYPFLHWIAELFGMKTPELRRKEVVAGMFGTFDKNPAEAKHFWHDVSRGGVDFEDSAPATVLDKWLQEAKKGELQTDPKPAQYYQASIYAWNAFREGRTIASIKSDAKKGFLKIAD